MKVIGFANIFYTLWDVIKTDLYSTRITANGEQTFKSGELVMCNYIKNVSMDITKVLELYPGVTIDESLRGESRSFSYTNGSKWVEYGDDVFSKGFSRGSAIQECNDVRLLLWSLNNDNSSELRTRAIENQLLKNGYVKYFNDLIPKEDLKEAKSKRKRVRDNKKLYDKFEKEGTLEVNMERNLDYNGGIVIDGLDIFFKDIKRQSYKGFDYSLPAINGVGKRVKGKKLSLTVHTEGHPQCESSKCLVVTKFEII